MKQLYRDARELYRMVRDNHPDADVAFEVSETFLIRGLRLHLSSRDAESYAARWTALIEEEYDAK